MSPAIIRKRFTAGAVRPAYSKQDKIQMWEEDGVPHREYVACGYTDMFNAQGQPTPRGPGTRVNQNVSKPTNPEVQSVQFFLNSKLKKKPDA